MSQGELNGCTALVTGCGQADGIGIAIARRLAGLGAALVITDVAEKTGAATGGLEALAAELRTEGHRVETVRADVRSQADCESTVARAISVYGRLDILVNNAAADHGGDRLPLPEVALPDWQRVLDVNLTGAFLMARAATPRLLAQGSGRIVNISSVAALHGYGRRTAYSASKAGVLGLTLSLAAELAASGITVNAVCPGSIGTRRARSTAAARGGGIDDGLKAQMKAVPAGRIGTPEDIAHAVSFFCSPAASYVTGQCLTVDGGLVLLTPQL